MKTYNFSFSGSLLNRGYWLYVWEISCAGKNYFYIGRTGDSSSPNAASPFSRISSHLNNSDNAKGNSLYRALTKEGLDPSNCTFHFSAFGPIYSEMQKRNMENHTPFRDKMAAFEFALYSAFINKNVAVLGKHGSRHRMSREDRGYFEKILTWVKQEFSLDLQEER